MKKSLSLAVVVVLFAGYLLSRVGALTPAVSSPNGQDAVISESALRHKHAQPSHWRALILRQY